MASDHGSRLTTYSLTRRLSDREGENGHAPLAHRLSRAEYDELRSNRTTEQGSSKISEPSSVVERASGDESMPNEGEIEKRFSNLLEKLTLDPEQVTDLKRHPIQHKWKLIQAKEMVEPKHSSQFYVSQLRRHMDEALMQHTKPSKKLIKDLEPKEVILRSLEVDVRTHPNTTWLREFLDEPYNGHQVLIDFLAFLLKHPPPTRLELERKKSSKSSKTDKSTSSTKRRRNVMARSHADEHMCLMCLKALMKNKFGFKSVMAVKDTLTYVVMCLGIDNIKTKTLAIKLLYAACANDNDKYHSKVIEALELFRVKTEEQQMFTTLVNFLFLEPIQPGLQAVTLALLNAVVNNSPTYNERIFHQQQICVAGFSDVRLEKTLEGLDATPVREELKIWKENFVNIQDLMDEYSQLKERSKLLRDEVDLLQGKLEDVQREKNEAERQKIEFEEKAENFRFRATELQTALEKLMKTQGKDGIDPALLEPLNSNPAPPGPPPPAPAPPPAPPPCPGSTPVPPPPPPGFSGGQAQAVNKRKLFSKKKLPVLNWAPVTDAKKTIFEAMDDEKLALGLDLKSFESMFELKANEMSEEVRLRKEAALKKLAEQITVIESNRARNLVIAKRRIGCPPKSIHQYINNSDLSELPPEHTELLLKFVPSKEELASLAKHADDYAKLAEAEQFMFEMAKVKRYESKLNVLAFLGVFDEVISTVVPKVDAVTRASVSVLNNTKLRKIFEIILAFGNYMNCGRRKAAAGFKLESLYKLQDIRSQDRKMSLLNYVVNTVKTHFPDLRSFADELCLQDATQVSKQTLNADIQSLKKGIDLTKTERDKQPNNFILFSFYNRAFRKVQKVTEKYRKMDETYTEVCQMFGENGKKVEPSEFFKIFQDFVTMYFQAEKENDEHKRQKEARRQAEIMMSSQRNKIETLPSVETAWNYTKDSDEYEDDYESISGSDGSDSS